MQSTTFFANPYAIEVLQRKKKDLVEGISNTEHLLNFLIDKGVLPPEKKILMSHYSSQKERNSRVLEILVSQGERACRLFFYPCLKLVEPDLYESIKLYVGDVNTNVRDARRQLIGYLLEKDQKCPVKNTLHIALKKDEHVTSSSKNEKLKTNMKEVIPLKTKVEPPTVLQHKSGEIFEAVVTGKLLRLEVLLKGTNINAVNSSQETLLHTAAKHGQVSIMEFLLRKGAKLEKRDNKGQTPLHKAAEAGNISAIKTLLQAGSDIYALDMSSNTPLQLAAGNKHLTTVKAFVEEEIRYFRDQMTFLHMAAMEDNTHLVQILLQNGSPVDAEDKYGKTALFHAVKHGFEKTAKVLLEADSKVDSTIMDIAFDLNNQSMYSLLLQYAKCLSPDTMDSLLLKAVQRNLEGIIAALIEKGTDINTRSEHQYTPLLLATEQGHMEAFTVLSANKANLEDKLPSHNSALHLAIQSGNVKITKLLLERGLDANISGSKEQTPLHLTALLNKPELVGVLLHAGAHVNAVNQDGLTALHIACQHSHMEMIAKLIKGKADIHTKDKHAKTALHWAADRGEAAVVRLLLSNGADANAVDKEKKTPLHIAAMGGRATCVSAMLASKARFRAKDMDGCTPLHYSAANGNMKVAAALLSSGKNRNVDDKNVWRKTPLHVASEHGHSQLIDLLLASGANINAMDKNKNTPLHSASRSGHITSVQMLVNRTEGKRVNLQATNNLQKTAMQMAESEETQNHQHIATLLKRRMFLIK